jgi:ribonuclease P protein component
MIRPSTPADRVDRLRRRADFTAVLRAGRRARRGPLTVATRPNNWGRMRVGYAVGRRVGGAVVRNRVRRRLRALIDELLSPRAAGRVSQPSMPAGRPDMQPITQPPVDIVITAFADAVSAPFAALRSDLALALRAVGVECTPAGDQPLAGSEEPRR